jgi:hypothetical protein
MAFGPVCISADYGGKSDQVSLLVKDLKAEGTVKQIRIEVDEGKMFVGTRRPYTVTAEYLDGRTEDVTATVDYTNAHPEVALVENGVITARHTGRTTLTLRYKGRFGDAATTEVDLEVTNRNPYTQNKASDFSEQSGVQIEDCSEGLNSVGYIEDGDWLKFDSVDFGSGAASFEVRIASDGRGGDIQIGLDSLTGPVIGVCNVDTTGYWQKWVTRTCSVTNAQGKHDVYLKFVGSGGYLFNVNWWQFARAVGQNQEP